MRPFVIVLAACACAAAPWSRAAAQAGAVAGRVVDARSGAPRASAVVRVVGVAGAARRAPTDSLGRFRLAGVPAGRYAVEATQLGYRPIRDSVTVRAGETARVELRLTEAARVLGEVAVQGEREAVVRERSAEAVNVVEVREQQLRTADLGEVLARTEGVSVQRGGGLGSSARFSLAGLTDDQVRFFIDGVPLAYAGYPFGLANIPVGLVSRAEVFRGVVPIRFGADALGGAVNLVSDRAFRGTQGAASYQIGSFGTHRTALQVQRQFARGLYVGASGFFDDADNNYAVRVQVPSTDPATRGQAVPADLARFNDNYRAGQGTLELGVADRPWADRLSLRAFATRAATDLQSNRNMTRPYGDVETGNRTAGGLLRYEHTPTDAVTVDAVAGYTTGAFDFLDVGTCIYDWSGACVRQRGQQGEISAGNPRDETLRERVALSRLNVQWAARPTQALRFSAAPTYVVRGGEDRLRGGSTAASITADRTLATLVAGVEHELKLFDGRLEQVVFGKGYLLDARSNDPVPGGFSRTLDTRITRLGGGGALRYALRPSVQVKASYEYATRLPRPDELFGDVVDLNANLELRPEVSHNVNLGLTGERRTAAGRWRGEVTGFVRATDDLILPLPAYGERFQNENVYAARSLGVETAAQWASPADGYGVTANATYLDFRNVDESGPLAQFTGDRIPNRPYLFANASARARLDALVPSAVRLDLSWDTRYVHEFFEFWESAGTRTSKRTVPTQLLHTAGATVALGRSARAASATVEVANLTDQRAFDFFGAQRPGRTVSLKTTLRF